VSTLHITNGDHVAEKLRQIVDGPVVITADPLHEGPAPRVDGDAWYDVRARYLAGANYAAFDEVRSTIAACDRAIAEAHEHDEVVLWFEHDLFDQLLLIRTLDLLARHRTPVSLICIGAFRGVERFVGLGQLRVDQLASLVGTASPVTPEQFTLATAAWDAFRSPDPMDLVRHLESNADTLALRFLGGALKRFLQQFPSTANGLSLTEELALHALSEGPVPAGALFVSTQDQEMRPFMGDLSFYRMLRDLAAARVPLITIGASPDQLDLRSHVVTITDAGRDVFSGARDHVALNGIDAWRGGAHLAGTDRSPWRWDAGRETLVS
jgi:hypothetical protein